jgi:predicted DNA-binding protein
MIRTQISMTEEQAESLRRMSARRHRSQAALLREALDRLLAADDAERRLAAARAAVGRHASGFTDTAVAHDEVLDEAFGT